ncbi:MAG: class I SAM-dependent methyltransferase [Pirellulaceae bacterium]
MSLAALSPPKIADDTLPLRLVPSRCCVCGTDDGEPVGVGEDFEYWTSPDTFLAVQCPDCRLVYLNPRPAVEELSRIYPPEYHAYDFNPREFGLVYKIRRRLEARRVLAYARGLPSNARILDIGCGDGFHLRLLQDFGDKSWQLEGVELDERAVTAARNSGLTVHQGDLEELALPAESYDLILLIQTIEHVADPAAILSAARNLLKPGGRIVIVTDDAASPSFKMFRGRHWGGYHFPRHWNLFDRKNLAQLARNCGLQPVKIKSMMSPVNWVYSFHNYLADRRWPAWLANRFTLKSTLSLTFFTLIDQFLTLFGCGSLLCGTLQKPREEERS